jgi:hypothetical protein
MSAVTCPDPRGQRTSISRRNTLYHIVIRTSLLVTVRVEEVRVTPRGRRVVVLPVPSFPRVIVGSVAGPSG